MCSGYQLDAVLGIKVENYDFLLLNCDILNRVLIANFKVFHIYIIYTHTHTHAQTRASTHTHTHTRARTHSQIHTEDNTVNLSPFFVYFTESHSCHTCNTKATQLPWQRLDFWLKTNMKSMFSHLGTEVKEVYVIGLLYSTRN